MPVERRRFRLGRDLCAYCASVTNEDREDLIPLALYPPSIRPTLQFLKIPACRPCNHAKSQVDGSLRDYLSINSVSQRHPVAMELFHDTVIRAAERNQIRLLDQFFEGRDVWRTTPTGIRIPEYEIPYDDQPVHDAVVWLTRGMHWAVYGTAIEADHTKLWLIPPELVFEWIQRFHSFPGRDYFIQGEPFTCGWATATDGGTIWAHSFFDSVLFMAITRPTKCKNKAEDSPA